MYKRDETRADRTFSAISSDVLFGSTFRADRTFFVSRTGDVEIRRQPGGLKAQILIFSSLAKVAPENLNISRNGGFECATQLDRVGLGVPGSDRTRYGPPGDLP